MMDFAELNKIRKAQRQAEAREVQEVLDRMRDLMHRVPPSYQKWNYQQVVAYKKTVGDVKTMLASARTPTLITARMKLNELEGFAK